MNNDNKKKVEFWENYFDNLGDAPVPSSFFTHQPNGKFQKKTHIPNSPLRENIMSPEEEREFYDPNLVTSESFIKPGFLEKKPLPLNDDFQGAPTLIPDRNKATILYNGLKQKHTDMPYDFNEFYKRLSTPGKAQILYDGLIRDYGEESKSVFGNTYQDFATKLGVSEVGLDLYKSHPERLVIHNIDMQRSGIDAQQAFDAFDSLRNYMRSRGVSFTEPAENIQWSEDTPDNVKELYEAYSTFRQNTPYWDELWDRYDKDPNSSYSMQRQKEAEELFDYLNTEIGRIEESMQKKNEEALQLAKQHSQMPDLYFPATLPAQSELRQLRKRLNLPKRGEKGDAGSWLKQLSKGFGAGFSWSDLVTLGWGDLIPAMEENSVLEKLEKGEALNDYEQDIFDLIELKKGVEGYIQSMGGLTTPASVGSGIGQMVPYMAGFATGATGARAITAPLTKKIAKSGAKSWVKGLSTAAINAVPATALTPTAYLDYQQRTQEQYFDEGGNLHFDEEGNLYKWQPTSAGKRLYQAAVSGFLENFSEMGIGELIEAPLSRITKTFGNHLGLGKLYKMADKKNLMRSLQKSINWNGSTGEFVEELFVNITQPLLTLEPDQLLETLSAQNLWETYLVCAITGGAMNVTSAAGTLLNNGATNLALKSQERDTLKSISSDYIRNAAHDAMHGTNVAKMSQALADINWSEASKDDIAGVWGYIQSRINRLMYNSAGEANKNVQEFASRLDNIEKFIYKYSPQLDEKGKVIPDTFAKTENVDDSVVLCQYNGGTVAIKTGDYKSGSSTTPITIVDKSSAGKTITLGQVSNIQEYSVNDYIKRTFVDVTQQAAPINDTKEVKDDAEISQAVGIEPVETVDEAVAENASQASVADQDNRSKDSYDVGEEIVTSDGRKARIYDKDEWKKTYQVQYWDEDKQEYTHEQMGAVSYADVAGVPRIQSFDELEREKEAIDTVSEQVAEATEAIAPETQDTMPTALSRIPVDTEGNQLFEQAPIEDSWAALVEMNEGDQAQALDTAQQMLGNTTEALEKLNNADAPKLTVADIQRTKAERKRLVEIQKYWSDVVAAGQSAMVPPTTTEPSVEVETSSSMKNKKRSEEDATLFRQGIFNEENGTPVSPNSASTDKGTISISENQTEDQDVAETPSTDARIEQAEQDTATEPTEAQKEAGNYKKGHIKIDGFDITIETPKGVVRSGVDEQGNPWSVTMNNTYGYIRGTEGVDGDHIDLFLSDHLDGWNGEVFVVDQVKPDGSFDEHKVMYGFNSIEEAQSAYLSNYSEGWQGLGAITGTSKEEFQKWIASSHRKTKPFAEYKNVKTIEGQAVSPESSEQISLEDYLARLGLSSPISDYMDDKIRNPRGLTESQKKQLQKDAAIAAEEYQTKRGEAIRQYGSLVAEGKITPPSNLDRLLAAANGHTDNDSTQSARKVLKKRGYDWRTGEKVQSEATDVEQPKVAEETTSIQPEQEVEEVASTEGTEEVKATKEKKFFEQRLKEQGEISPVMPRGRYKLEANLDTKGEKEIPALQHVIHQDGFAVATDSRILVADKGAYQSDKEGKWVDVKGQVVEPTSTLAWQVVVNTNADNKGSLPTGISPENVLTFVGGLKAKLKEEWQKRKDSGDKVGAFNTFVEDFSVMFPLPNGEVVALRVDLLEKFARAAQHLGATEIMGRADNRPIFVQTDKGVAMLMPVFLNYLTNKPTNYFAYEQPIIPLAEGEFGPIYDQFRGKPKEAIAFLLRKKNGEALGALSHPEIGEIDLVWGVEGTGKSDGYGLAKLSKYHPEILENLQEILNNMQVTKRTANRVQLENVTHKAAVRLTWNKREKTWLLTAFEKKEASAPIDKTTDTDDNPLDLRGDTALSQSTNASVDKDTTIQPKYKQKGEVVLKNSNTTTDKIEDFGEKIGGARKDVARERVKDSAKLSRTDLATLKDPDKILSRTNIIKYMREGQMTPDDATTLLALNMAVRGNSGGNSKAVLMDKYRQSALDWVEGKNLVIEINDADVEAYISAFSETIRSRSNFAEVARKDLEYALKTYQDYKTTYEAISYPEVNRAIKSAYIRYGEFDQRYWVVGSPAARRGFPYSTLEQAVAKLKKEYPEIKEALAKSSGTSPSEDKVGHLYVTKDNRGYYRIKSRQIPGNIYLSGRLYSKKEAEQYLKDNAEKLIAREDRMTETLMGSNIGMVERKGKDYRQGKDVTPQDFLDTFGFRGVEFGNWVPQAERQLYLNKSYDAIMDLCEAVGISPKAFSLGGRLGLAFGARGKSRALAHYEPVKEVINLTRLKGAGSLAHEWFHALDNYMSKQVSGNVTEMATSTHRAERTEVTEAFRELVREMDKLPYTKRSQNAGDYWGEVWERAARLFQSYIYNSLQEKNTISPLLVRGDALFVESDNADTDFEASSYPYPSAKENEIMKPYFDKLFDTIQEREEDGKTILYQVEQGELARTNANITTQEVIDLVRATGVEVEMVTPEAMIKPEAAFYSNAEHAVQNIKQEKATPEQWLKMIEKNGGLKAGEDKWLGLSDWLKAATSKTLTKQEVLDYVDANKIQVEDVEYADHHEGVPSDYAYRLRQDMERYAEESVSQSREDYSDTDFYSKEDAYAETARALEENLDAKYGEGASRFFSLTEDYEIVSTGSDREFGDFADVVWQTKNKRAFDGIRPSNSTRTSYTTKGLTNKREIALVVPTIEAWNRTDEVHFGDAGEGRAVAWVRFGETTDEGGNRVLVIDEIQSKRHQEGREKGYFDEKELDARLNVLIPRMLQAGIYVEHDPMARSIRFLDSKTMVPLETLTHRATNEQKELMQQYRNLVFSNDKVKPAPFEKNWHEVAMKRVLRYAAENGFDKVAWTTGDQQAERYDISKTVDNIKSEDNNIEELSDGTPIVKNITIYAGNSVYNLYVDKNGVAHGRQFGNQPLADIVGKPLAEKLMEKGDFELEGDGLRIGGEGMRAFYDQILPNFMNKYGKKWGVEVGEVTMPDLAENNTMHSVDVTPDMRESVLRGQPLFLQEPTAENPQGAVYGWMTDGKIYLTERGLNPETPIHEYTHIWDMVCQQENPELWAEGVKLMKQLPLWEEVRTNPAYEKIADNENLLASEVHARLVAPGSANILDNMLEEKSVRPTLVGRLRTWLSRFWRWLRKHLLPDTKLTIAEFKNMPLKDLVAEKRLDAKDEIRFRSGEVEDYTPEEQELIAKAKSNGTYLKAPNGKPSNLTPRQWVQVRTKAFKKWFGDWEKITFNEDGSLNIPDDVSKIVNANGEPLVVWHGSNWKGITSFDRSQSKRRRSGLKEYGHFFTTNRALAEMYSLVDDAPEVKEELARLDAQIEAAAEKKDINKMLDLYTEKERITRNLGGRVYEVFLNMRDVAEFDAEYQAEKGWYNLKADVGYKTAIGRDAIEAYAGQNGMTGNKLRKDGIIARNIIDLFVGTENKDDLKPYFEKYGGDVFLVFDPQNIKSATENIGTFDANNPDIRYRGGEAGAGVTTTQQMAEVARELAASLHTPIEVYTNVEDITDANAYRQRRMRRDKGWWTSSGKIGINLTQHESISDVEATILHEVVGHKGLREVVGNEKAYNELLDRVWEHLTPEQQKLWGSKYADRYEAMDEYLATLAEGNVTLGVWDRIVGWFRQLLDRVSGRKLQISDRDIAYLLWKSRARLQKPKSADEALAVANTDKKYREEAYRSRRANARKPQLTYLKELSEPKVTEYLRYYTAANGVTDKLVPEENRKDFLVELYDWLPKEYKQLLHQRRPKAPAEELDRLLRKKQKDGSTDTLRGILGDKLYDAVLSEVLPVYWSPKYVNGILRRRFQQELRRSGSEDQGNTYLDKGNPNATFGETGKVGSSAFTRKLFDNAEPVRKFQQRLVEAYGVVIDATNNLYSAINRWSSRAQVKIDRFTLRYINPLLDTIKEIEQQSPMKYKDVSDYLTYKHAIERHDSGVTSFPSGEGVELKHPEWNYHKAHVAVKDFESVVPKELVDELWRKVNLLNKTTLDNLVASGNISLDTKEHILSHHWQYYVPLSGWDMSTTQAIDPVKFYDFGDVKHPKGVSSSVYIGKIDEGRITKPGDPLAAMINFGCRAIISGENNKMKLVAGKLCADAEAAARKQGKHPELVFDLKKRYAYKDLSGKWRPLPLGEDMNEEFLRELEISKMKRREIAFWKSKLKDPNLSAVEKQDIFVRITRAQEEEVVKEIYRGDNNMPGELPLAKNLEAQRIVTMYVNGEAQSIIFADPLVAMAINGELTSAQGKASRFLGRLTRTMSGLFTSYNPAFVVSNVIRDFRHSFRMHLLDSSYGGVSKFTRNLPYTYGAIWRSERGKAKPLSVDEVGDYDILNSVEDRAILMERYGRQRVLDTLYEIFEEQGGLTGYVFTQSIDEIESNLRKLARRNAIKSKSKVARGAIDGWEGINEWYDALASVSEGSTRFATFLASLERGSSSAEAAQNAKDITVNFNRKGEWSKTLGTLYLFFNASMQAAYQEFNVAKNNPWRTALFATYRTATGIINALLADYALDLINGDDEDERNDLDIPLHVKLSNTVIPLFSSGKYIKIPLAQGSETLFNSLGVYLYELMAGKMSAEEFAGELSRLPFDTFSPLAVPENGDFVRSILPTVFTPLYDVWVNEDYLGRPIHRKRYSDATPEYQLGLKNTPEFFVNWAKSMNSMLGGNDIERGSKNDKGEIVGWKDVLEFNPSDMHHILQYYAGGSLFGGKFFWNVVNTASYFHDMITEGKSDIDVYNELPIVRRFLGEAHVPSKSGDYYHILNRLKVQHADYLKYRKRQQETGEPIPENILRDEKFYRHINRIHKVVKRQQELMAASEPDAEKQKAIQQDIQDIMFEAIYLDRNVDWDANDWNKQFEKTIDDYNKKYRQE